LKDATEFGKLADAFKLLITHDKAEEQSFTVRADIIQRPRSKRSRI
jgi:hypothetical protein